MALQFTQAHLFKYSRLLLSRPRLSRITAYLEVKTWSLLKNENLIQVTKYCGKEEKLLQRSNFSSFPQYFQHISNFKSPITSTFVKCGCSIYFFLKSANLICRSTDISKYFWEFFGVQDNESRLYYIYSKWSFGGYKLWSRTACTFVKIWSGLLFYTQ